MKEYVIAELNEIPEFMQTHIKVGDKVIVVDGSYMTNKQGFHTYGIEFKMNDKHELLEVKRVNIPLKTDYRPTDYILGHHNNCEIIGEDGSVYNCSLVNIRKYKRK